MSKSLFLLQGVIGFLLAIPGKLPAQPYFDVAGVSAWQMPASLNGDNATETEGYCFLSFPFDIGKKSKLIASPFYETRFLEMSEGDQTERLQSLTLPIAWVYEMPDTSWSVLTFGALRSNSTQFRFNGDVFQVAGAIMVNYRVNRNLVLKTGVYLSKEFYGDFYMWLVGIEWKINDRLNLFGLVNNNLRLEYKLNNRFYGGFAFKSINTSYRENGDGGYYKISDNHLGLYADVVLGKKIIWNMEAGHTILRYIKSRNGTPFPELNHDGFVFKTGFAYRIRLWN